MNIHFPGIENLYKATIFVFPKILVCMDCGFTEFAVPETELHLLGKNAAAFGTRTSLTQEGSVDLSEFVLGWPFSMSEIEICESAADEPFALKNGFYCH
jgi:hypothetical protein